MQELTDKYDVAYAAYIDACARAGRAYSAYTDACAAAGAAYADTVDICNAVRAHIKSLKEKDEQDE